MATRLIHVSDLHTGAAKGVDAIEPLGALVARVAPELVVVTGDVTHRGRRSQHAHAADMLRSLGSAVLVVPGNHDVPFLPPARLTRPWVEFEREWETTEPVHRSDTLHVVGVNSVRPWRHQSGGIHAHALDRACTRLGEAPPAALRVACLHHQLANAPWRSRKRPLARRGHVLARLAESGAELVLSGHVHQATVADRREFAVLDGDPPVVVVSAPGLTRPRPHRLGEAQGAHVISADDSSITVATHILGGDALSCVAERRFQRQ